MENSQNTEPSNHPCNQSDHAQITPPLHCGPYLIVCLSRKFGGADIRVLQTARGLAKRQLPFVVVVLQGSQLHQMLERENLSVQALRYGRADPRIARDLVQIAKTTGSILVDAHNMQSQYWGALAALIADIPGRVATVHSVYRETHPRFFRRHLHEGALRLCHLAGFRFITVSSSVQNYLQALLSTPTRNISLSINGLEPLDDTPQALDLRALVGWPDDSIVLTMIGRLETIKGHRHLFAALRDIVAGGDPRPRLVVVGEGRDSANLRLLVAEYGLQDHVHFTGFRGDIPNILAGTDLFCQPSDSEGLPYSVLEACRQGVPVLASELPGIVSVFTDDETMFLTPPCDAMKLGERLKCILDDPTQRQIVGKAAMSLVKTDLSVDQMIDTTLKVYGR